MMLRTVWPESFPDVVANANRYYAAGQYLDAGVTYLKAAAVAPTAAAEQFMLEQAWVTTERARGVRSELDA